MDNHTVSLYISFRCFQFKKKRLATNFDTANFKLEYDLSMVSSGFNLFEVPRIDLSDIIDTPHDVFWLKELFSSKLMLAREKRDSIYSAVMQLNKHMNKNTLTKDELVTACTCLDILCKKALGLKNFDPNIIKIAIEVLILRSYIDNDLIMVNHTYGKLSSLFQYVKLDFYVLYKLTEDPKFHHAEIPIKTGIDIWDYIAALGSVNASSVLGNKILAVANAITSETQQEETEKMHLVAIASYWLARNPKEQEKINEATSVYKKPVLERLWFAPQHNSKRQIITEHVAVNSALAYFLFNRLNPDLVSEEILTQILSLYKSTIAHHDFSHAIDLISLVYADYYLSEFKFNSVRRKDAFANLRAALEKNIETDISITVQGRRIKYFSQKLVNDSCPITHKEFFNFNNNEESLISLSLFKEPNIEQLEDCLASFDLQAYQKRAFNDWIKKHSIDYIDRRSMCFAAESVADKINLIVLRKFLNIKRLQDSVLLMMVSEKWFEHRKLNLLISLDPGLFEPKFLMHIEQLDFSKLSLIDISYFNRHFEKNGTLPLEIIKLRQTAVRDYRCNIVKENINISLLRLFDELDELNELDDLDPLLAESSSLPVNPPPINQISKSICDFRFGS